jgi:hypothetical protein
MEAGKLTIESADGREGYLIWCGGNRYVFRIYTDAPHEFTDYDIHHTDMKIKIMDSDAFFYSNEQGDCVDHAPDTLGIKHGNV